MWHFFMLRLRVCAESHLKASQVVEEWAFSMYITLRISYCSLLSWWPLWDRGCILVRCFIVLMEKSAFNGLLGWRAEKGPQEGATPAPTKQQCNGLHHKDISVIFKLFRFSHIALTIVSAPTITYRHSLQCTDFASQGYHKGAKKMPELHWLNSREIKAFCFMINDNRVSV